MSEIGTNSGHGHAWVRPDGLRARCGGRGLCAECARDFALVEGSKMTADAREPMKKCGLGEGTHHFACECREAKLQERDATIASLRADLNTLFEGEYDRMTAEERSETIADFLHADRKLAEVMDIEAALTHHREAAKGVVEAAKRLTKYLDDDNCYWTKGNEQLKAAIAQFESPTAPQAPEEGKPR